MAIDVDRLGDDPAALRSIIRELAQALVNRDRDLQSLRQQIARLLRHRFGRRCEKLDPEQLAFEFAELREKLNLLAELHPAEEPPAEEPPEPEKTKKKGHGRSRLTGDDTPVPVLDREKKKTREGRLYVYVGDTALPFVVFDCVPDHTH